MRQLPRLVLLALLRGYKWALSPILPPSCRYVPTCSEYAAEAIDRYGAVRGSAMATWRPLCCHVFVTGGYDPVPDRVDSDALVYKCTTHRPNPEHKSSQSEPAHEQRVLLEIL